MFQINDTVAIALDAVITSNGTLLSAWSGGEIVAVTEKAINLQATLESGATVDCWLPKKALRVFGEPATNPFDNRAEVRCTLAKWFRTDGWTARFLKLSRESYTMRAA